MQFLCGLATTGVFNVRSFHFSSLPFATLLTVVQVCLTLYVDLHPKEPGLASVAISLIRCLVAAAGVAVMEVLLEVIGSGWTFTFYGLLCGLSVPMLLLVRVRGGHWRSKHQEET